MRLRLEAANPHVPNNQLTGGLTMFFFLVTAGSFPATNGTLVYTITVGNDGTDPVNQVLVRDVLPAGTRFISITTSVRPTRRPPPGEATHSRGASLPWSREHECEVRNATAGAPSQ